ncbi:hypothetical protein C8R44DRAFT_975103 [Mycena epipterygia]|nr:hypothetical protein C8R44DRAFT_975103 [Mycena epipterygia]
MALDTMNVCLRSIPSLEQVEISDPDRSSESTGSVQTLVELLAHDSDFLPALSALSITRCAIEFSLWSLLVEMLECRWKGDRRPWIARLQFFCFVPLDPTASLEEIKTKLRPLMNEGLEVVLGSALDNSRQS